MRDALRLLYRVMFRVQNETARLTGEDGGVDWPKWATEVMDNLATIRAALEQAELEAQNAELVADRERLAEVHAYLLGEAPLDGKWFGDELPPKAPRFWWRNALRQAIDSARVK